MTSKIINYISASRIIAAILVVAINNPTLTIVLTIYAAISDFLDGALARLYNLQTPIGAKIDQLADKIATSILLINLIAIGKTSSSFLILLITREVIIIILREKGLVNSESSKLGKIKTFFLYSYLITVATNVHTPNSELILESLQATIIIIAYLSIIAEMPFLRNSLIQTKSEGGNNYLNIKKGTGTVSSLITYTLSLITLPYTTDIHILAIGISMLCFHFTYFKIYSTIFANNSNDPREYTLDEIIAILALLPFIFKETFLYQSLAFILFRYFDIMKPLGIKYIESSSRLSEPVKVIADDLIAILYTIIVLTFLKSI